MQLASESAQKQLEAGLAAAKRDAAQAAAAHKSTAASRQSELDWQKAEASRACLSSWLPRLVLFVKACLHVAHVSPWTAAFQELVVDRRPFAEFQHLPEHPWTNLSQQQRRDTQQAVMSSKHGAAALQGRSHPFCAGHESWQSVQVGRLRRELERMELERDRAREAAGQ